MGSPKKQTTNNLRQYAEQNNGGFKNQLHVLYKFEQKITQKST
jgi:hypothetical protein